MSHERIRVGNTKDSFHSKEIDLGYSRAVKAGNMIFLQGQTGLTLDGKGFVGKKDPAMQAENAMRCVKLLLEEVGAKMEDICKIVTYVTDKSYRKLVYPVIARHLKGVNPVSTGLVVKGLATSYIDFEIDVFAVIPETN